MQIVAQQVGPDLAICQGGIGPIVTLWLGPNSAPAAIADAPIAGSPENNDTALIIRNGELMQIELGDLVTVLATPAFMLAALNAAAAAGVIPASRPDVSGFFFLGEVLAYNQVG